MALPFFESGARKKRDQILAIDLGSRTTKAVYVQRRGAEYSLNQFALLDAPVYDKTLSVDLLTEHLKSVVQALNAKTRIVSIALGVNDALVRHVDMPRIPQEDMRQALKISPKNYLQQDLPNHIFDCYVIPPRAGAAVMEQPAKAAVGGQKQKVLVAGARKQVVDDFLEATRTAGLLADNIMPSLVCPYNAFEKAMPEMFAQEIVALVDIGFYSSSICILQQGELVLSRVVSLGGHRVTEGLAETMNISYAEAEGIKVGMPAEVQPQIEALVSPLGRELRASLDFFEHQSDRTVSQVFVSGGSARSELVLAALQAEMMVECKSWNPTANMNVTAPNTPSADLADVVPQLSVAIGAAFAAL